MERKIYGIFLAGGQGLRMGTDTPKQFLILEGLPVLQRTIERFIEACPGMEVITVLPKNHFSTWKALCIEYNFNYKQTLVEGGITRFHSVKNALQKVPEGATVLIHDGVRPIVSVPFLQKIVEHTTTRCAVIPVLPSFESLKSLEKNEKGELVCCDGPDPDRSRVFSAQTPQAFHSEVVKWAYDQAYDLAFTDDASVVKRKNIPLSFVAGERWNIKLTTKEDLAIARFLLGCRP